MEASELSQIALERTTTARDAIRLMGDLATTYGFYSAVWDDPEMAMGEGGEALSVIDKSEAWIFHVIPDNTGSSAVWVAQRVPDDHIAVVANTFVIREVDEDSDSFMFSSNLHRVAMEEGFWHPNEGKLNFLRAFVPQRLHPNYCHRRVWRVFSLAAPSLNLPSTTDAYASDYPFSVKVDQPLSTETVISWQRDHYEGTEFSTTQGLAGGPYGDPNRFDFGPAENLTLNEARMGEFPRTISLFRTSYAVVAVSRDSVPNILAMTWLCQYAPDMSSFFPFYVAANFVPFPWMIGSMARFNPDSVRRRTYLS